MLATLAEVKREIKEATTDAVKDLILKQAIRHITARIEAEKRLEFEPRLAARRFNANSPHILDHGRTLLMECLLAVTAAVEGGGTTLTAYDPTAETGDYVLVDGGTPDSALTLLEDSGYYWTTYNRTPIQAVGITGHWGYHTNYAEAWVASGDTVEDNPLTAGATTITVNDADGVDGWGLTPRFSYGQLLRIESEFVEVIDTNTTTNVLTVRRGARGSTAASHVQNTAIEAWQVEPTVNRAALKWAAYLYARTGAFEQTKFDGVAAVSFPPDLPGEVQGLLNTLRKRTRVLKV